MNLRDVYERERAWIELAKNLYTRLAECQITVKRGVPVLPDLPTHGELDRYADQFRELFQAVEGAGLHAKGSGTDQVPARRRRRKRWWWPF